MGMMINRRRAYSDGLPYDYEVEYIKFYASGSGNKAILKFYGLPTDGYMDVDLDVIGLGNSNDYPYVFGFQEIAPYPTNEYWLYRTLIAQERSVNRMFFERGASSYYFNIRGVTYPYKIAVSKLKYHIMLDENKAFFNLGGGAPIIFRSMKLYDTNYNLVFDVIPVSVNGIGQLYDKISGKLGESTGNMDFIAGPRKS